MANQVHLIPSPDVRAFLQPLPALLNDAQSEFAFSVDDSKAERAKLATASPGDVDAALLFSHDLKVGLGLRDEDLLIRFTIEPLHSLSRGLTNLFVAGSNLSESPPRVATVSTSFFFRHVLPSDPTYLMQRHAIYHLIVCCVAAGFLDLGAHEDRGCLLDYNNHTPNIRRKLEAGYIFCESCAESVGRHPLGNALFDICGALKVASSTTSWSKPVHTAKKHKIFLCYAGSDRESVGNLCQRLRGDGFDPWMDKEKLLPGQDWQLEIRRAIQESDFFIACLSRHFERRTYGLKEIKLALDILDTMPEGAIFLVPARLELCRVESRLESRQWVDLFEADGYDKLTRALRSAGA